MLLESNNNKVLVFWGSSGDDFQVLHELSESLQVLNGISSLVLILDFLKTSNLLNKFSSFNGIGLDGIWEWLVVLLLGDDSNIAGKGCQGLDWIY